MSDDLLTDADLRDKLADIALWQRIQALASAVLIMIVVVLWLDVRSAAVRLRWAERYLDKIKEKAVVVDEATLEEWRKRDAVPR